MNEDIFDSIAADIIQDESSSVELVRPEPEYEMMTFTFIPDNDNHGRYESKNKIIYLENDAQKKKQYLFSTSIYTTVTELHDIQGGTSTYWDTVTFWEIVEIFSYEIVILDLPEGGKNHYVCVFTQQKKRKREVRPGVWELYYT